jgi:hypothetical protein
MNEIELLALKLMRLAWSVIMEEAPAEPVVEELNRLERLSPEMFEQVVCQLQSDNGRWSKLSELPQVEVNRNERGLVEKIIFKSGEGLDPKSKERPSFIWVSDHAEKKWLENFTQDLLSQADKKSNA